MTVLLRRSDDLLDVANVERRVLIPDHRQPVSADQPAAQNCGAALECAFDAEAENWWSLGKMLSAEPSGGLAHMPSCVANASDFGTMLAWTRLIKQWAKEDVTTLVVCDDPWVFRHLDKLAGVMAGSSPPLLSRRFKLWVRGYLSRSFNAVQFAWSALRLQSDRSRATQGDPWLLVYGHPASTADGIDGYFGSLLQMSPQARRALHVDCSYARAKSLARDGRTVSLHGFGNPFYAFGLPFRRWRPRPGQLRGEYGWLIRRAVAYEGGTGQAAAIAWQLHCQRRWLARCRPATVAWPWENHAWERAFVRSARGGGVRTIGYQHSVIGPQMLNYSGFANCDGTQSLPDRVLCTGEATRTRLSRWGLPTERLAIGGALRFHSRPAPRYVADAPVFMALPFDGAVAHEMVETGRRIGLAGRSIVAKDHPMTPFAFADSPGLHRTAMSLEDQPAVSAVVYAATSVGLEAILSGLPTFRYRPRDRIALNILPDDIDVPAVDAETLADALNHGHSPPFVAPETVFAPVDWAMWQNELRGAGTADEKSSQR